MHLSFSPYGGARRGVTTVSSAASCVQFCVRAYISEAAIRTGYVTQKGLASYDGKFDSGLTFAPTNCLAALFAALFAAAYSSCSRAGRCLRR